LKWLRSLGGRGASEQPTEPSILEILDAGCRSAAVPMLDNGYLYLAATRLSLFRSDEAWAMTFEIFGFSPRTGEPDVSVWTLGNQLVNRKTASDFVDERGYAAYLRAHRYDEAAFFSPIDGDQWIEDDWTEMVAEDAPDVTLRGRKVPIPAAHAFAAFQIDLRDPPRIRVFELCRYLAAIDRQSVLATEHERRTHVGTLPELLVLDDWHHPDTVTGEVASDTRAFRSLAAVLDTGDVSAYDPSEIPNTHWRNWPEGGSL
jgi:hypothetical protein